MAFLLPSNLETIAIGVSGWNAILTSNMELINTKLGHLMSADAVPGVPTVDDPAAVTYETLTDSSTGTPATTIVAISGSGADDDINDNMASLAAAVNKLNVDMGVVHTTLTELLAELRKSTGVGVLGN
jgi:K+-transporting ATPase c subunit